MKLKKKHFKKLKEIAVAVNQIMPGTGIRLDKLIADIESVQKPTDEAIYEMYRKEAETSFLKEGKAMVAASTDDGTEFKGGLRGVVESVTNPNEISGFLDSALVLSNTDPKIGDVGYFWDEPCISAVFGKIDLILESFPVKYQVVLNGEFVRKFSNFSKTPPELK